MYVDITDTFSGNGHASSLTLSAAFVPGHEKGIKTFHRAVGFTSRGSKTKGGQRPPQTARCMYRNRARAARAMMSAIATSTTTSLRCCDHRASAVTTSGCRGGGTLDRGQRAQPLRRRQLHAACLEPRSPAQLGGATWRRVQQLACPG